MQPTDPSSPVASEAIWSPPLLLLELAAGDDALILELVEAFLGDAAVRIEHLRAAVEARDFSTVRKLAHTIKGGARQVGADAVADGCQELEFACAAGELPQIRFQFRRVQESLRDAGQQMAAYVTGHCRPPH